MNTQEIQHQKNLTKITKSPKNINQFLTKNPNLLNTLNQNYTINREHKNLYTDEYKYDENIKNKQELKTEILKFVIDLIYEDVEEYEKERFFKVSNYFINEKVITRPFKLISKLSFDSKLTSINTLYNYIVSKGRTQEPIFNEDIEEEDIEEEEIEEPIIEELIIEEAIIEEPIIASSIIEVEPISRDCNICFETYTDKTKFLCENENCNNDICPCCFIRIIRPRKCPFCRNDKLAFIGSYNYDNEESDSDDSSDNSSDSDETAEPLIIEQGIRRREIRFIYENQIRIKNIRYDYLDENEIILLTPKYNTIEEATLRIDTLDYLRQNKIEEIIDDLERNPDGINTEFLYQNILSKYNDVIDYDTIEYMKNECKTNQILHLLGWVNNPRSDQNRKNGIVYLICADGIESTFNFDFINIIEEEGNGSDEGEGLYLYASSLSTEIFE